METKTTGINNILQKHISNESLHRTKTSYALEINKHKEKHNLTKSELDLQMAQALDKYLVSVYWESEVEWKVGMGFIISERKIT